MQQLYNNMPSFLERALLQFQREGVLFGLAHNGRCLIAVSKGGGGNAGQPVPPEWIRLRPYAL